jgi:hypothetical protein
MKNVFLVAFLLFVTSIAFADKKSPTVKATEKTAEMQKGLQLTPEQNKKIYEINFKAYTSIAEYEAKKPSKKLKKKQKDIVQKLRDDQYKKILSAAQYKLYRDLKKKEKEEEKALDKLKK